MTKQNSLISLAINEAEIRDMCQESISEMLKQVDTEYVFWDTSELKRRTCMSWNTIQDTFFYDPRFPKSKVGGKWYFPVREARTFLETWLNEKRVSK